MAVVEDAAQGLEQAVEMVLEQQVVVAGVIAVLAQELLPAVVNGLKVAEHLAMEMEEMVLECLECMVDPVRAQALLRVCEIDS